MEVISSGRLQILLCHLQFLFSQVTEEKKKFLHLPLGALRFHLRKGHWMWGETTDQILASLLLPCLQSEDKSFLCPGDGYPFLSELRFCSGSSGLCV